MYYLFFKRAYWGIHSEKERNLKISALTLHTETRKKELFKSKVMRKILEDCYSQHLKDSIFWVTWSLSRTAWSTLEAFSSILHQIIRDCAFSLPTSKGLNLSFWLTFKSCVENTSYLIEINSLQLEPVHHCGLSGTRFLLPPHLVVEDQKHLCLQGQEGGVEGKQCGANR